MSDMTTESLAVSQTSRHCQCYRKPSHRLIMVIFLYTVSRFTQLQWQWWTSQQDQTENRDIPNEITPHSLPRPSYHWCHGGEGPVTLPQIRSQTTVAQRLLTILLSSFCSMIPGSIVKQQKDSKRRHLQQFYFDYSSKSNTKTFRIGR